MKAMTTKEKFDYIEQKMIEAMQDMDGVGISICLTSEKDNQKRIVGSICIVCVYEGYGRLIKEDNLTHEKLHRVYENDRSSNRKPN